MPFLSCFGVVAKANKSGEVTAAVSAASVNEKEMELFRSTANSWWNDYCYAALRAYNMVRVPWIKDALVKQRASGMAASGSNSFTDEQLSKEPLLGFRILDIGCGGGFLSEAR